MALNLGVNFGKLNPLGNLPKQDTPSPVAPTSTGLDYLDNLKKTGEDIKSKIDQHVASQTPSQIPVFDINPAQSSVNSFKGAIAPTPTGGGMLPPTTQGTPLPSTPEQPVTITPTQEPSIMDNLIPKASAQAELSDDEIKTLIKEGYSDEEISKANEDLKSVPEPIKTPEAPKEEPTSITNNPITRGISDTLGGLFGGASKAFEGMAGNVENAAFDALHAISGGKITRKSEGETGNLGAPVSKPESYGTNLLKTTAGLSQVAATESMPAGFAAFNIAAQTPYVKAIPETISKVFDFAAETALKAVPGNENLTPEQRADLKSTVINTLMTKSAVKGKLGEVEKAIKSPIETAKKVGVKIGEQKIKGAETDIAKGENLLYEAVNPTTRENKAVLKERVQDLLPFIDKGKTSGLTNINTLEAVKGRVDAAKESAGNNMTIYENMKGVKGTVDTGGIIKKLQDKYQEKIGDSFINKDEAMIAQDLIKTLKGFGEQVKDGDIIKVRRAWDQIEKKNKGFAMSAEATSKGDIFGEANKVFREEIRKSNPEYAKELQDYHKTATLSDVLGATIQRRVGQQQGGFIKRGFDVGARITGAGLGGLPGYLASEALIQGSKALSSPEFKLTKGAKLLEKGQKVIEGKKISPNISKDGVDSNVNSMTDNSVVGGKALNPLGGLKSKK